MSGILGEVATFVSFEGDAVAIGCQREVSIEEGKTHRQSSSLEV